MQAELAKQVHELFQKQDNQSIKYLIRDQLLSTLNAVCDLLNQSQAVALRNIYKQAEDQEASQMLDLTDQKERNKKIDKHLSTVNQPQIKKQQNFLEAVSKIYEKLIYEQHFGFPFYDLFKRIHTTHGDFHPNVQSVKAMHSQVQILYSVLFREEVLKEIAQKHPNNFDQGTKSYLSHVFPVECQKYFTFLSLYRNLKKETSEQPIDQEQDEDQKQIQLSKDETLQLDQKQFLVSLAQIVPSQQFQQFNRNRSYNFMCFSLKKYQAYISIKPQIYTRLKQKQFCELLSFLTLRFIRKIIFAIIRERGNGVLKLMKQPITPSQIKRIGNDLIDICNQKVQQFLLPIRTIQEVAHQLFVNQFGQFNYKDFIPIRYFVESASKGVSTAEYAWNNSKQYKTIWSQRVKAEKYIKDGGERPQLQYLKFIESHLQKFKNHPNLLWKQYIMNKFGFDHEIKSIPRKRMKLDSLND